MAGEQQFTPEAARGLIGVVVNPEAPITGTTTADLILKATAEKHLAGQSEESLKIIAREALPHKKEDVEKVVLWNLSSERDVTTKAKKAPIDIDETRRVNESKTEDESVRILIESGTIDPIFRDKITAFLETNPSAIGDVIRDMRTSGDDVDGYVEGLMKMPGFRNKAMELHTARFDPTKRLTQETQVQNFQVEIDKLAAKLASQVTQVEIDTARTDLDTAETKLESHPTELLQYKSKNARYKELTDGMAETKKELRRYEGVGKPLTIERSNLDAEKASLITDPVANAARIGAIDSRLKQIDTNPSYLNYTSRKAEVDEHSHLETEIAGLQTTLGPLQKEVTKKQSALDLLLEKQKTNLTPKEKAAIEAEIDQRKSQLADSRTLLEAEQMKFYRDATHIGEDAMEGYLNAAFNGAKATWKAEATAQAGKDGGTVTLVIEKVQNHLWKTKTTKGNLTFYKPDRNRAQTILNEAFKAGGGENIAIYLETKTPAALGITPAEHAILKEKLKDPAFRKAQSEGIGKQALADYLLAGGRVNGDLVKSLATSQFGQDLLNDARTKTDEYLQKYKDQFGKGVLDKGTRFGEFMKKSWWIWGIGILALIIFLATRK